MTLRCTQGVAAVAAAVLTLPLLAFAPPSSNTAASSKQSQSGQPAFDAIINNGTIVDGSGADRFQADVGIRNGIIAEVGKLDNAQARTEVDASGLYVTPGFINMHSHADPDVMDTARNMLEQGVTTEIINADGGGSANVTKQLDRLARRNLAINYGAYVGFGAVREKVIGLEDRHPTDEETAQMRNLVDAAMQAGAFGVSSGLAYTPGSYASTQEIIDVVEAAQGSRTMYTSHLRDQGPRLIEATREAIKIGKQTGLMPELTHYKAKGPSNWGIKSRMAVQLIRQTIANGTYVTGDVYPYLGGQTSLTVVVPNQYEEGGFEAMLERFSGPNREQIAQGITQTINERLGSAENLYFPATDRTLADAMAELGVDNPGLAVIQLLEEAGHDLGIINFYGNTTDLVRYYQQPNFAVACDCGATTEEATHPRYYGSWPKVLGEFVRERHLLTWEFAIKKMTGLPATMLGMPRRGFIAEGMIADVTIFNPDTITDRATFEDAKQYAKGVRYVFVHGRPALWEGKTTELQPGRVLRHGIHMPARAMSSLNSVQASGEGWLLPVDKLDKLDKVLSDKSGSLRKKSQLKKLTGTKQLASVNFSVQQPSAERTASGDFSLDVPGQNIHAEVTDFGKLQASQYLDDSWAGFTGTVRLSSGQTKPLLVLIEENQPHAPGKVSTVTIKIGDKHNISGYLVPQNVDISISSELASFPRGS